ncbi:MAG: amidohydrolase family protein [Deltaproteobacteria bacterium]|nr:amidohydrolase family protein [Deltaproteobacteria bacterium]
MHYIDFHTHAFPDKLAFSTIPALEKEGNVTAALNGTISSLLDSMNHADIAISVLCSIATRPEQFASILSWCQKNRSNRIVPFPSFHPESPTALQEIEEIHRLGFKGVKMHPFYQDFYLDEKRLYPFWEKIAELDPAKIAALIHQFPDLKFVATHLGAWDQWEEVQERLVGENIYMDIAFSLEFMDKDKAKDIINAHPSDKILFGSDSPWGDQANAIRLLKDLKLGKDRELAILRGNAEKLLRRE